MPIKMHPSIVVHPGPWLASELVAPAGLSVTDLAARLGVPVLAASKLLDGADGITADMANRFEKLFGVNAATLMRMQTNYDLAQARAPDQLTSFDPVEHLTDVQCVAELLAQARATGDGAVIARAVQIAARACELRGFSLADLEAVSDNPEWSEADLAAARPFAEVFPELAAKMRERRARDGCDNSG